MVKFKKFFAVIGMAAALALGGTALSATPAAPLVQNANAASYAYCFIAMDGSTWCYRYNCTWFEQYALGCYTGWVQTKAVWWA